MATAQRILGTTLALAAATAVATVSAGGANAYDLPELPRLPFVFDGAATLTVGPQHSPVSFAKSDVKAFTDIATLSATFTPPAATTTIAGMSYTIAIVNPSEITGTAVASSAGSAVYDVSASQTFAVRVTGMTVPGLGSGSLDFSMLPSSVDCTSAPVTVALKGPLNAQALLEAITIDTTLSGPVAIPAFTGCGVATPAVNAAVAGSGNTYSIGLSNARRGTIEE